MAISNINIEKSLKILDFQFNQESSSVYFVSELVENNNLHPKIILDLDKASYFNADAVYFRFFDSNRLPQPQIYIYDNSQLNRNSDEIAIIHRNIWSASEIPAFIVINKSVIQIYDSRKPIETKESRLISKPIAEIDLNNVSEYNEIIKLYNAKKFDNGSFWESEIASRHFLNNKTAYEKLVSGLKSVREFFRLQSNLSSELSDHILILSVLVKYLEENGIDDSGINLAKNFFYSSVGFYSFTEIIKQHKVVELFDKLSEHFNGGLFYLNNIQKNELKSANWDILVHFFEGTLVEKNQLVIWAEYSFKHIPIELISNFYEEFLPKEKNSQSGKEQKKDTGAVYTPSFLVNFLVDECLPLNNESLSVNVKLIDISCGSGIFLVSAFKRLVQRWRVLNKINGKLADTTPKILQQILRDNIYGVDIDKNAAELTIFSLNLSLCSMLTPKQIWTELRFDDLNKNGNIAQKDFIKYFIQNNTKDFDLVIGNPPFKSLSDKDYKEIDSDLKAINSNLICKIPDKQLALIFLNKGVELLKENGLLCLIMPSGPLLYNNTLSYRKLFFEKYNIPQIIDFTFLRNTLFERANVAVAALFVEACKPDTNDILHVTVKRTRTNKEKNYFEIDHYDFHEVPKEIATTVDYVWKTNLVGGGRIYHLIDKLKSHASSTLREFLQLKRNENGWDFGQGYKIGNRKKLDKDCFITNKESIVDKYFKENGIQKTEIQSETHFETIPKSNLIFKPPHLLIKKTIGMHNIPLELCNKYLTFRNEVIGIHCPEHDIVELEKLSDYIKFNNQIFRFYITATSARFGVQRTPYTILLEDIEDLPIFPEQINLSLSENILLNDVLNYSIDHFAYGENAKININATILDLKAFSEIYTKALNSIYSNGNKSHKLSKIYEGNAFYACEFIYTDLDINVKELLSEKDFSDLINNWSTRNALIKRTLRIYGDDMIILIKPKQMRYWLQSIALRDVDETLKEAFDLNVNS